MEEKMKEKEKEKEQEQEKEKEKDNARIEACEARERAYRQHVALRLATLGDDEKEWLAILS